MNFSGPRYTFTMLTINGAPADRGVFWLWDGDEVIYIARATGNESIKACLESHCAGDYGACTQGASHYGWEVSAYPAGREAELLEDFARRYRRPPRCQGTAAQR
jgi:hypothetical protein